MKNFITALAFLLLVMLYEGELRTVAAAFGLSVFVYFAWATFYNEEDI